MDLKEVRAWIAKLNSLGIPMPMVRDPKTGASSVSLTLVFLSSIYVQLALLNSFALMFKGIDVTNALYWHGMCVALYFGRSYKKDGAKVELDGEDKK
jgi:hypothetical protein